MRATHTRAPEKTRVRVETAVVQHAVEQLHASNGRDTNSEDDQGTSVANLFRAHRQRDHKHLELAELRDTAKTRESVGLFFICTLVSLIGLVSYMFIKFHMCSSPARQ